MANFPVSIPSFSNPSSGNYLNSPPHATQHDNENDEITAIATKVGIDASADTTSFDYKLTPRMITDTYAATVTFDLSTRGIHNVTLTGSPILALSNETVGQAFVIRLIQDGAGSHTVTWFSTIKWSGAVVPTLTTTALKTDVFGFVVTSSGNYDGYIISQNL